ncbi:MAG: FAD-dependent oxidoreductase [Candidatus Falkowbacteria bacterium]
MNYDLLIIGAGPAGYTASIYASRYKINHAVIGELPGGLMSSAHKICNFPSEIEVNGFDLTMKMKAHADSFGTEMIMEKATSIEKNDGGFVVKTVNGKELTAKTILLATGTVHRDLGLAEESRFVGKGLSYCATCDAMFFKNKTVAVIGGGNSALTAALYLAEVAEKVYLVVRNDEFNGEVVWIDQVKSNSKIEVIFNDSVTALEGVERLESIKLSSGNTLAVTGIFVEVGSKPDASWFSNLNIALDPAGYIKVSADSSTNQEGIWAAGDITDASNGLRQIITACSEGAVAAAGIFRVLQKNK